MALPPATQALQNEYDTKTAQYGTGIQTMLGEHGAEVTNRSNELNTQYGIPDLTKKIQGMRENITGMQTRLTQLPSDITKASKGFNTTQNMANRQISAESQPLQENLSLSQIALNPMETNLATAQTNKANEIALLKENQAREETGYTAANQATLNALLDKLQNQRTLDAKEIERANALADQQTAFNQSKALAAQSTANNSELYKILTGGNTLPATPPLLKTSITDVNSAKNILGKYIKSNQYGVMFNDPTVSDQPLNREELTSYIVGTKNQNDPAWKAMHNNIVGAFAWNRNVPGSPSGLAAINKASGLNKLMK